jgi:Fe-S-cluster containining protein
MMDTPFDPDFHHSLLAAGERAEVRQAIGSLYQAIQTEIDQRRPVCVVSGRCCRFEEYGHRLFVTTMELACFRHDLQSAASARPDSEPWDGTGCPFQHRKLCSVHAIRPMGCRLFFCDASAQEWQNDLYERFHAQLKRLHDSLEVPYRYMEWRQALQMAGLAAVQSPVVKTDAALTIG